MKLGIMQPYLFPYMGYFQLINAVDRFVIYDDVNFIKQGWINRNRLLVNGKEHMFTIQLKDASSFRLIKDTEIHDKFFEKWKTKFIKSIEMSYKSAPFYNSICEVVQDALSQESMYISNVATHSLKAVCNYIGIKTSFIESSASYHNSHLSGQTRVIDICKKEKATHYINLKGGMELYAKKYFKEEGITLKFISTKPIEYAQFGDNFIPALSIIDILMFNSREEVVTMLNNYELL